MRHCWRACSSFCRTTGWSYFQRERLELLIPTLSAAADSASPNRRMGVADHIDDLPPSRRSFRPRAARRRRLASAASGPGAAAGSEAASVARAGAPCGAWEKEGWCWCCDVGVGVCFAFHHPSTGFHKLLTLRGKNFVRNKCETFARISRSAPKSWTTTGIFWFPWRRIQLAGPALD